MFSLGPRVLDTFRGPSQSTACGLPMRGSCLELLIASMGVIRLFLVLILVDTLVQIHALHLLSWSDCFGLPQFLDDPYHQCHFDQHPIISLLYSSAMSSLL